MPSPTIEPGSSIGGRTWLQICLPQILDDAIKKQQAQFYKASEKLTAEELYDIIPMTFPMTLLFAEFPGIAKYPIDLWEREGHLALDKKGWCKLIAKIASKDMLNLGLIFDRAKTAEAEVVKKAEVDKKAGGSTDGYESAGPLTTMNSGFPVLVVDGLAYVALWPYMCPFFQSILMSRIFQAGPLTTMNSGAPGSSRWWTCLRRVVAVYVSFLPFSIDEPNLSSRSTGYSSQDIRHGNDVR